MNRNDVRPGLVVVVAAEDGGYRPDVGWDPTATGSVQPLVSLQATDPLSDITESVGDDQPSWAGAWVALRRHLEDVELTVRQLAAELAPTGISAGALEAAAVAGRLHDVGKAHPVFQATMAAADDEPNRERRLADGPWAKSGSGRRTRHSRAHFRHELASALALLGEGAAALDSLDPSDRDLVVYLVAAHHGRVRLAIRSLPGDATASEKAGVAVALGIMDGEELPAVDIPGGTLALSHLDLSPMMVGFGLNDERSWTRRALDLRDREDLGPFRLAWLEALLRLADWRASAVGDRR